MFDLAMFTLVIILIIAVVAIILIYSFPIVYICGNSMYPTYKDGEKILSTRLFFPDNLKVGDVVIFIPPSKTHDEVQFVIKRVQHINDNGKFFLVGDNLDGSYDSRDYGYVDKSHLISKAIKSRPKR